MKYALTIGVKDGEQDTLSFGGGVFLEEFDAFRAAMSVLRSGFARYVQIKKDEVSSVVKKKGWKLEFRLHGPAADVWVEVGVFSLREDATRAAQLLLVAEDVLGVDISWVGEAK